MHDVAPLLVGILFPSPSKHEDLILPPKHAQIEVLDFDPQEADPTASGALQYFTKAETHKPQTLSLRRLCREGLGSVVLHAEISGWEFVVFPGCDVRLACKTEGPQHL